MKIKFTFKAIILLSFFLVCGKNFSYGWTSPTLSTPSDGSIQWTGLTLDWGAVASSVGYQLQLDTSATFSSSVRLNVFQAYINSSSGNSDTYYYADNLFFGKTYHWRVRAYISGDTSAWSTRTFITTDYVNLSSPTTGSAQWTGVTVDWSPHTGVDFYDMEADTSASFNSPAKRSATNAYINSSNGNSDTYYYMDDLYFGKKYYWRVRARNAVDTCAWSSVWDFTTADYVNLSTPTTGSVQWTGLTLEWAPHAGVDFYDMETDTSALFNSSAKKSATTTYINSSNGNTDTYYSLDNLFFGKKYYWRVRARNAFDTSSWSTVWDFTTADYVNLTTPTTGSVQWTGVTLDWSPHTGVDFYDMEADTSALFNSSAKKSATTTYINSSNGNPDTYYSLDDLYFGKKYYWRVRVRNAVDTSAWSSVWDFTTADYVNLTTPTTGSVQWTGVTLDWSPHTGVDFYDMEADTSASFNSPAKRSATNAYINSSNGNSDTYYYMDDLYFGKKYYWRVRARNAIDTSTWTPMWNFTTADYVTLATPSDAATNISVSGVTLDWSAHAGIDVYQMQLDTVNLFNTPFLITVDKIYINSTSTNSDTYYATGALLSNQMYFWRVRAINAVDTSAWTSRSFTTGTQPILIPTIPVLLSPANGAIGQAAALTLDWNNSTNVTGYDFLYDTDPAFISPVSGTATISEFPVSGLDINNITYYWKVRAFNGTALYSDWSAIWHFTTGCNVAAPMCSNDAVCDNGSVVLTATGTTVYNWYDSETGGNLIGSSATYNTPILFVTDTFYVAGTDGSCESNRTMVIVMVNTSPTIPVISLNGISLESTSAYSYQWMLSGSIVGGATNQTYTPVSNGNYTVVITDINGCSAESDPFPYLYVNVPENYIGLNDYIVYPNPASENLFIRNTGSAALAEVFDIYGKLILPSKLLNEQMNAVGITKLANGCYLLVITNEKEKVFLKFIKE